MIPGCRADAFVLAPGDFSTAVSLVDCQLAGPVFLGARATVGPSCPARTRSVGGFPLRESALAYGCVIVNLSLIAGELPLAFWAVIVAV